MSLCFFYIFKCFFVLLMSFSVVFKNKNVQNYKYRPSAFLMGKDSISWTERVFCSSIIDYLFRIDGASYLNGYCSLMFLCMFFKVFLLQ